MEIKVNEKAKKVLAKITTCKGEVIGFSAIDKPSVKFNPEGVYTVSILIPKKEGEALLKVFQDIKKQQYKTFGKGSTAQDITRLKPFVVVEKNEDGEIVKEIPDVEGRYVLKASEKATVKCKNGTVFNKKIGIFDAKGKPCREVMLGEGSIVRLAIEAAGYTVAGKTGLSVNLKAVQVIEYKEYGSEATFTTYGFEEEEGFESEEETEKETTVEEDEEAGF